MRDEKMSEEDTHTESQCLCMPCPSSDEYRLPFAIGQQQHLARALIVRAAALFPVPVPAQSSCDALHATIAALGEGRADADVAARGGALRAAVAPRGRRGADRRRGGASGAPDAPT